MAASRDDDNDESIVGVSSTRGWPRRGSNVVAVTVAVLSTAALVAGVSSAVTDALPGFNIASGKDKCAAWVVVLEALVGRCRAVRRRVISPRILFGGVAWRRMRRGVLLTTKSPFLGDMGLDFARRGFQQYRLLSHSLAPNSITQLALTLWALRRSLADKKCSGPCGGIGTLVLAMVVGSYSGGLAHYGALDAPRTAQGGLDLVAAVSGARFVADCRLARATTATFNSETPSILALLVIAGALFCGTAPASVVSGFAGGALVGLLCSPRLTPSSHRAAPTSNLRDARDATRWRRLRESQLADLQRPWLRNPWAFALLALVLQPRLRGALLQLFPALATARIAPGLLSGRTLNCPPRFIF